MKYTVRNGNEFAAYSSGVQAFNEGHGINVCPHPMIGKRVSTVRAAWFKGYHDTRKANE